MKNFFGILCIISIFLFGQNGAKALDIIYPQQKKINAWKNETYVLGNVQNGAKLTINGEEVKIYPQNIFCHIVTLKGGENKIVIEETTSKGKQTQIYTVNKPLPQKTAQKNNVQTKKPQIVCYKDLLSATVITDGAPVREKPSVCGNRISHLSENTSLLLDAEFCDWFRIYTENPKETLWIYKKNVKTLYPVNNRYLANIRDIDFSKDKHFEKMTIALDFPVPYKLSENGNNLELTIWGIKDISEIQRKLTKQKVFPNLAVKTFENNNLTLFIPSDEILWGYDAEYNRNELIFSKRKQPKINPNKPLNNQIICIDAGHGGKEKGTVGPSRIPEKDVNLAISLFLKQELEKNGAKVVMTRETDTDTEIYGRPEFAKKEQAIMLISIHANSMVDGNPYKNHGVETYYYHPQAKNLADTIKKQMVKELGLQDNGTNYASFVLTRPAMPVSVLVEVAYMPNPYEYLKLIDKNFQQKTAVSICNGLKNYFSNQIPKKN
ncbi:MAG: N-acetylmuramoyl-L-alanine amidase [Candidatus Gastranaerophilales bacterium]|nr:N-acetylmuramoyl-L-alanine amidase [Candidatus Gastranaerophilales bacterium]